MDVNQMFTFADNEKKEHSTYTGGISAKLKENFIQYKMLDPGVRHQKIQN